MAAEKVKNRPVKPKIGIGYRVGSLSVEKATDRRKNGYTVWKCRCDCGGEVLLDTRCLQRGTVTNCRCRSNIKLGQKDITGMRFDGLVALEPTDQSMHESVVWRCVCDCGKEVHVSLWQLQMGYRKSCRCLQSEIYRKNLRLTNSTSVSLLEAGRNRLIATNTSGHTGFYRNEKRGKWVAQITFKGKIYLGTYDDKQAAVRAREAGEQMHEDFLEWYYADGKSQEGGSNGYEKEDSR